MFTCKTTGRRERVPLAEGTAGDGDGCRTGAGAAGSEGTRVHVQNGTAPPARCDTRVPSAAFLPSPRIFAAEPERVPPQRSPRRLHRPFSHSPSGLRLQLTH